MPLSAASLSGGRFIEFGIDLKSFQTDFLKNILYSAIFFQPFDHLVIADQRFINPFIKSSEILCVLCKCFFDDFVKSPISALRAISGDIHVR